MQQHDDQELIAAILDGSHEAFEELMRRYERLVFKIGYSFTRDREEALDLTQEVFVRAYEKLDSYRGDGAFAGWLMRLARNAGLNWIRGRKREPDGEVMPAVDSRSAAAKQETELIRREERALIFDELERLNPRQHLAVTLRYFEQMPLRSIADALDCSEGTVKSILFRSLEKLRRQMAPHWRAIHE